MLTYVTSRLCCHLCYVSSCRLGGYYRRTYWTLFRNTYTHGPCTHKPDQLIMLHRTSRVTYCKIYSRSWSGPNHEQTDTPTIHRTRQSSYDTTTAPDYLSNYQDLRCKHPHDCFIWSKVTPTEDHKAAPVQ